MLSRSRLLSWLGQFFRRHVAAGFPGPAAFSPGGMRPAAFFSRPAAAGLLGSFIADHAEALDGVMLAGVNAGFAAGDFELFFDGFDSFKVGQQEAGAAVAADNDAVDARVQL